jgi:hypothetical protein
MNDEQLWNKNWQGKPKYSEKKTYTIIAPWSDLGWSPGRRAGFMFIIADI